MFREPAIRTRRAGRVLAGLLGAIMVLAGCATQLAGTAQPVVGQPSGGPGVIQTGPVTGTSQSSGTSQRSATSQTIDMSRASGTSQDTTTSSDTSAPGSSIDDSTVPESSGPAGFSTSVSTADGTVTMSRGDAPVTVDIFAEPICPPCASFQLRFAPRLTAAVTQGKLAVRTHLMTFLDAQSASTDYSTRVVAALLCTASTGADPAAFGRLEEIVFSAAFQPKEDADRDRTDAEITAAGRQAAVGQSALNCFRTSAAKATAKLSNSAALKALTAASANGTPTVLKDGKMLDWHDDWLTPLLGG